MIFLLSVPEDTLISRFVERNLTHLQAYMEYYDASVSLARGYLFPKFYIFYDDAHITPVPYFRYQYVDTVHLRLEEREMDLGFSDVNRVGSGFVWSLFDPQVIAWNMASREASAHARSVLKVSRKNSVTNFRILLRTLNTSNEILKAIDSALSTVDSLRAVADTLRSMGRIPPPDYLELRVKLLRLRKLREGIYRKYLRVQDTVESLTGMRVESVEVKGELPECETYDSTHLVNAQRWSTRAEMARFLPKIFAFGEVWYGRPVGLNRDSLGTGTVYGLRIVLTFDETGRLKVRREKSLLNLLTRRKERVNKDRKGREVDTTTVTEALGIYGEALSLYRMGRIDRFTLARIKLEYYTLKVEALKEKLENLKERTCPVILPEVPPQRTPLP